MSPNKRQHTPPFEIIGRINSSGKSGKARPRSILRPKKPSEPVQQNNSTASSSSNSETASAGPWWKNTGDPVVLRIPRGVIILAFAALIGLLIVAYFVGYSMGQSAAINQIKLQNIARASEQHRRQAPSKIPQQNNTNQATGQQSGYNTAGHSQEVVASNSEETHSSDFRRKAGLNYLILATYPKDWALRLQKFMAGKGEVTILSKVSSNKYQVIVVSQGFSGDQLNSQSRYKFEKRMRSLGQAWKKFNDNQGDALGSMYFSKYTVNN